MSHCQSHKVCKKEGEVCAGGEVCVCEGALQIL